MTFRAAVRWLAFAVYVGVFFTLPPALLWEMHGLVAGALFAVVFLYALRLQGTSRIARKLKVRPLASAQCPELHAMVVEYCRRLQMPTPRLGIIETPAVNLALFGFSRRRAVLAVTRGAMQSLRREELSALVGRQLCYLWYGDTILESWLSRFLATLDSLVTPARGRPRAGGRRAYPFRIFLRQLLLYPLVLIPSYLLRGSTVAGVLDEKSARLTRKPFALSEALRKVEAMIERIPFVVPFSARHLFLVAPPPQDPLARVFFSTDNLSARIQAMEKGCIKLAGLTP